MQTKSTILLALCTVTLAHGASRAEIPPTPAASAPAATPAAAAATPVARADALAGKVLEILDGGGYTFFQVEQGGEKFWVATPPTRGKVGEEMSFQPGIEMRKFKSKSLDRTFEVIYFSGGTLQSASAQGSEAFLMNKAHSMKPPVDTAAAASGAEAKGAPAASPQKMPELVATTGKLVEKLDGGAYTYYLVEEGSAKTWVAAPALAVKVGETVSFKPGFEMKEVKSKALDRTFDRIIFTDGLASGAAQQDPAQALKQAHSGLAKEGAKPADKGGKPLDLAVAKAAGANGYTVAELYEKSGALNGTVVAVRGKVVKISKQIMGKNWVHLQDGSGDATAGSNNLVVTTQDVAAVGDVVTATGTLAKDKDFGGGYQYAVIIEETKLGTK